MNAMTRVETYGTDDAVLLDRLDGDDGIYIVTMNNPETLNTLSVNLMHAIANCFNAISARKHEDENLDEVRAVILRAEGKGFTVGLDIGKLDEYFSGGVSGEMDPFAAVWDCPFPVVGAMNGPAVTGGFEIALGCDMLLATPRAVFMDNHAKYGVHPGRRLSQRLMKVVGINSAKFACMSSFPIDAELALKWGLVQQICATNEELDQKAIDVAKMISRNHPMMTKRYKSLMEQGNLGTYAEGLVLEDTSDKSFYETLTDLDATLKDGAGKFQEMLTWAKSLP